MGSELRPGEDVAEACADALLAAVAQAMILQGHEYVSLGDARYWAVAFIDRIIQRTEAEGAKPRGK